ncbi:MAG: hypothetical protein GWP08_06095 [Nitrospiraceae bacterium]|nr:hypothetical protein [Nitrospiraceae bacterium]
MRRRPPVLFRILIVSVSMALSLTIASTVYRMLAAYSGELCVAVGASERVVVRQSSGQRFPLAFTAREMQRDIPADDILFQNPGIATTHLDATARYDALLLPFTVHVRRAQVLQMPEAVNTVVMTLPEGERSVNVALDDTIEVEGETYTVTGIHKWSGLLRHPTGEAMAMVSLHSTGERWHDSVFLIDKEWRRVESDAAVLHRRFDTEREARDALAKGLPRLEAARWGAVEGATEHWFTSFAPGTAIQLADGTGVMLLRFDAAHATPGGPVPAIEVRIDGQGQPRTLWVAANDPEADPVVRFDYFTQLPCVIFFDAWADNSALVTVYHEGILRADRLLSAGQTWAPERFPYEIRLDQTLPSALPVTAGRSTLYEAVLRHGDDRLRLRQGESVRVEDTLLQFTRTTPPPDIRYEIVITSARPPAAGETPITYEYTLTPGESFIHYGWTFSLAPPSHDPQRLVLLHVER